MPSATLDTNVLLVYLKQQKRRAVVERLVDLSRAGKLELVVTARIREDVPDPPLSASIDGLGELSIQEGPSVTRVGVWALGRDVLGSDEFVDLSQKVSSMLQSQGKTPPDWRDWDHLHAHYLSGRDVFLTWDRRILDCGPELKRRLDLVVMRPEQYVESMGA